MSTLQLRPVDVRRAAMDLLARREHGFDELIQKLTQRFTRRTRRDANQDSFLDSTFDSTPDSTLDSRRDVEPACPQISLLELITTALDQLRSEGLQSDVRMAEAFVRARANKGRGPVKIRAELRVKGLDSGIVAQALEACGVDWFELVQIVAEKKFGDTEPNTDFDLPMKAKRSRFLQQRGFTFDHICSLDS